MRVLFDGRSGTAALLALGLSFALVGCGGGGGGGTDVAAAIGPSTGGTAASGAPSAAGPAPATSPGVTSPGGTSTSPTAPASTPSTPSTTTPSTTTPSTSPPSAAGPTTPAPTPAVTHYALGPQSSVVPVASSDFQDLVGMSATVDGGYRIVWTTSVFDTPTHVQTSYYEQRYDAAGQRIGDRTLIAKPTDDMSGSLSGRADALDGGSVQVGHLVPDGQHPTLFLQHYAADGTAIDAPVELGGPAIGWRSAMLSLPSGAIAITWQSVSHVGPAPLQTAVLAPAPR